VRTRADHPFTPELIIGTRWSNFDPIGRFLELTEEGHEDWHHLCLPLVAGPDDDIGRKEGELLWPEKFEPRLKELQRDPVVYAALYQQAPLTSSGNFFNPEFLPIVDMQPVNQTFIIASDIALSTDKGDWSVHLVAGIDENRNLTIIDIWRERKSSDIVAEALQHLCNVYTPTMVLIDDDNASKVFRQYLFEKRINVPIMLRPTRGQDKQVRAANARAMAQHGRIHIKRGQWNHEFLSEVTKFPDIRHDDQVDCLALLGREAYRMAPPPKTPKLQKNEIGAYHLENGRIHTRDTLDDLWKANRRRKR
jgi:predicted phage terminase large subunit-like protein